MIRFILVTFLFLAWGFYELSGGSSFEPQAAASVEETVAPLVPAAPAVAATDDIVTRGVDTALATIAVPERLNQPLIAAPAVVTEPAAEQVAEQAVAEAQIDAIIEDVAANGADVTASAAESEVFSADLREVAGARVNMRTGPGTDFGVVTTLDAGSTGEVVETDPSGWVKLRMVDSGLEGWMAERLLVAVTG